MSAAASWAGTALWACGTGRTIWGEHEEKLDVDELVAFAFDCWPEVSRLPLYRTLQLRRRIGPRGDALPGAVHGLRFQKAHGGCARGHGSTGGSSLAKAGARGSPRRNSQVPGRRSRRQSHDGTVRSQRCAAFNRAGSQSSSSKRMAAASRWVIKGPEARLDAIVAELSDPRCRRPQWAARPPSPR